MRNVRRHSVVRIEYGNHPLAKRFRLIGMDGVIYSPDLASSRVIPMLLDTGAFFTEIDAQVLRDLGYPLDGSETRTVQLHLGAMKREGLVTSLSQIQIGSVRLESTEVTVSSFAPDMECLGLIGLSLISKFRQILIDPARQVVELWD